MSRSYEIEYGCVNIKGGVRGTNQDNFYVRGQYRSGKDNLKDLAFFGSFKSKENALVCVYDGMGGESCGDMASLIAAGSTKAFDGQSGSGEQILGNLCQTLNGLICEYASMNGIKSMGSTAAVMRFSGKEICFANVGDSRIYRIDNAITQLSEDHTAKGFFQKKAPLTQYLGLPEDEMIIIPYLGKERYRAGTTYLLCSDGITDMLSEPEIYKIIYNAETVREASMSLVSAALKNGGIDNITAVLCHIKE